MRITVTCSSPTKTRTTDDIYDQYTPLLFDVPSRQPSQAQLYRDIYTTSQEESPLLNPTLKHLFKPSAEKIGIFGESQPLDTNSILGRDEPFAQDPISFALDEEGEDKEDKEEVV